MIAICERTSIEITLENATNYAVYALLRLFSIIDTFCVPKLLCTHEMMTHLVPSSL